MALWSLWRTYFQIKGVNLHGTCINRKHNSSRGVGLRRKSKHCVRLECRFSSEDFSKCFFLCLDQQRCIFGELRKIILGFDQPFPKGQDFMETIFSVLGLFKVLVETKKAIRRESLAGIRWIWASHFSFVGHLDTGADRWSTYPTSFTHYGPNFCLIRMRATTIHTLLIVRHPFGLLLSFERGATTWKWRHLNRCQLSMYMVGKIKIGNGLINFQKFVCCTA